MELQGQGTTLVALCWLFQGLAIIVVAIRMFARICLVKNAGRDDWTMVLGLGLSIFFTAMVTASAYNGTGQHFDILLRKHAKELPHAILINTIAQAAALHSFTIPKLSIAFLLVRIFNPNVWIRTSFYFFCATLISLCVATTFIIFLQCDPINDKWAPSQPVQKCWSPQTYSHLGYATGAVAGLLDLMFAIYPGIVCSKLHMSISKRIGLMCLFGVGFIGAAFTIFKTTLLLELSHIKDLTYDIATIFLWTNVEANVIIIAGSIPTINPVIRLLRGCKDEQKSDQNSNEKRNNYNRISGNTIGSAPETAMIRRDEYGLPIISDVEAGTDIQRPESMARLRPDSENITRTIDISISRESAPSTPSLDSRTEAVPQFLADTNINNRR